MFRIFRSLFPLFFFPPLSLSLRKNPLDVFSTHASRGFVTAHQSVSSSDFLLLENQSLIVVDSICV